MRTFNLYHIFAQVNTTEVLSAFQLTDLTDPTSQKLLPDGSCMLWDKETTPSAQHELTRRSAYVRRGIAKRTDHTANPTGVPHTIRPLSVIVSKKFLPIRMYGLQARSPESCTPLGRRRSTDEPKPHVAVLGRRR